ncbi:hypothetical protein [Bacillus marinisedimentorum]|uniref:hypothetical protein n=1 Tax=Bacillus marinisedimentorum TaxID=1821260 RepID=UPI00087330B1|nr:hypothetical protein [Bacillus marinisedimentorum]
MQEIKYYNDLVIQFEEALARDLTEEERLFLYQIARAHHSVPGISKWDNSGKWDRLHSFLLTR